MSHPQEPSLKGPVFFYPAEYYVLCNFSAFEVEYRGKKYPTSEHAYQATKFFKTRPDLAKKIQSAKSAHEAFKMADKYKKHRDTNWDNVKVDIMKEILHCKVQQHEYVKRKLLQTKKEKLSKIHGEITIGVGDLTEMEKTC